jgi:membrane protease YdiL (CAAX protease family)
LQQAPTAIDASIAELSAAEALMQGGLAVLTGVILMVPLFGAFGRKLPAVPEDRGHPRGFLAFSVAGLFLASSYVLHATLPSDLFEADRIVAEQRDADSSDSELPDSQPLLRTWAIMLGSGLLASTYLLLSVRAEGGSPRDLGFRAIGATGAWFALAAFLVSIFLQLGAMLIQSGVDELLGREPSVQVAIEQLSGSEELRRHPLLIFAVVIGIPFIEELFFRALLLAVLLRHLGALAAISIDVAVFAVTHDAGYLTVFTQGILLACLYWRTRNLWVPFLFHALHNGLTVLLIQFGSPPG